MRISADNGDGSNDWSFDNVGGTISFTGVNVGNLAGTMLASDTRDDTGGSIKLMFQACGDNNFRDMDIALAFVESRLAKPDSGERRRW